jgi:hypothetical protein
MEASISGGSLGMVTCTDAISTAANGALRVPIRSARLRRRAHSTEVPASATITALRHVQAGWLGIGAYMASRWSSTEA